MTKEEFDNSSYNILLWLLLFYNLSSRGWGKYFIGFVSIL